MTDISPSAFAELQNDVSHVKKTLDQLASDVRPLMLARSGDLAAVASTRHGRILVMTDPRSHTP